MGTKFKSYKNYFVNLICPAFIFGSITGVLTAWEMVKSGVCATIIPKQFTDRKNKENVSIFEIKNTPYKQS